MPRSKILTNRGYWSSGGYVGPPPGGLPTGGSYFGGVPSDGYYIKLDEDGQPYLVNVATNS